MSIGKVFQNVTAKTASVGKQVCSKAAQKAKPALEQGEVKLANALDSLASSMKAKVAQKQVASPRINKITSEIPVKKPTIPAISLEKTAKKADIADLQEQIRQIFGISYISVFESGSDVLQKYGDSIYTYYNDGYRSLAGFAESYPHFCCSENEYALYFNQNDFSWAGTVFVMFLTPISITGSMHLLLNYLVGASQDAEFYLVKKTDKTWSELAQYIYEEIKSENALKLSFKWLYSDTFISVMQSLENVSDGEYYLAFKGTSDNSHPMVKSIKFMKG